MKSVREAQNRLHVLLKGRPPQKKMCCSGIKFLLFIILELMVSSVWGIYLAYILRYEDL